MKRQLILCSAALITSASLCSAQLAPGKAAKSAPKQGTIVDLEKTVTEAFKNKQVEVFKKYLAPEFVELDAEGFKNAEAEIADIPTYDVRENSFANMKVVFLSGKVAVATYQVTTQATHRAQEISGTYNVASVWMKRERNWRLVFHTFMKTQ